MYMSQAATPVVHSESSGRAEQENGGIFSNVMHKVRAHSWIYFNKFNFREKSWANRNEGLLRPLMEPVNASTVDNSRELASPDPQCGAYWRETQHHLHNKKWREMSERYRKESVTHV